MCYGQPQETQLYEKVIEKFEEKYPDVKVKLVSKTQDNTDKRYRLHWHQILWQMLYIWDLEIVKHGLIRGKCLF
jgi:hypothetical protein